MGWRDLGNWQREIDGCDVVINLAGRSVNCRYTVPNAEFMQVLREACGSRLVDQDSASWNPIVKWLRQIYVRVSTKEQTENLSLPTQLRACEEYCRRQGYEVLERFHEERESAKTTDRSQLQKLLTFCRLNKGRVHFVVVFMVDQTGASWNRLVMWLRRLERLRAS